MFVGYKSFDLAEFFQTPVFVLSDLDLGMNVWMSKSFTYPETPMNRGKVLSAEQLQELGGKWGRYVDVDGDGVTYRTLPGTEHPTAGYFTRGTGHNEKAGYSKHLRKLGSQHDPSSPRNSTQHSQHVPKPEIVRQQGGDIAVVSFGTNHQSILEAVDLLKQDGLRFDYLRIRALPTSPEIGKFLDAYERIYVIENNFNGQMHGILLQEYPTYATRLISISRQNGMPLSASWIQEQLKTTHQRFLQALARSGDLTMSDVTETLKTNAVGLEKNDYKGLPYQRFARAAATTPSAHAS